MLKLDEEQAEKWLCKHTRERGGLPPCPFSDRLPGQAKRRPKEMQSISKNGRRPEDV
jgi:ribosomal protein L34E